MKLILEEALREKAIRVDLAWNLFFEKSTIPEGHGGRLLPFANWLWDELGKKTGNLNRSSGTELTLTVPALSEQGLDFLVHLASFWSNEVYLKKGGVLSENLWRKPVVNVFEDGRLDASERSLTRKQEGSYQRFFMPLLGPGRAFFRVEVVEKGESAARFHSHSEVDEYYLILEGLGTLRFNDKDVTVKRGDLIGKPTGPDDSSQIIADQGETLRILDMEVWHDRPYNSKDLVHNPDFNEIYMRGPGWGTLIPVDALLSSDDFRKYYDEGYKRTKDGGWVPSKSRGHKKVRVKPSA
jgi:uncharacterized cupin superfamily protein